MQANQSERLWVFGPKPFGLLDINKKQDVECATSAECSSQSFGSVNHGSLNREIEDIVGS